MGTKAALKQVRSLQQKKYREQQGLFLVQGVKPVLELLSSTWRVEALYATAAAAGRIGDPRAVILEDHELQRIGTLEAGNEVVAVVHIDRPAPVATLGPSELVIALDGISDPGNMGTLLRIADWFGVARVICSADCVEEFNPKCVQASMGSLFRVGVHRAGLPQVLGDLQASGAALYLASMEGEAVFDVPLARPAVLVLGSESHGVSQEVRALAARTISIPRRGGAESLNVAAAAAALCMEFDRQVRTR